MFSKELSRLSLGYAFLRCLLDMKYVVKIWLKLLKRFLKYRHLGVISIQKTFKVWCWLGSQKSECREGRDPRIKIWAKATLRSLVLEEKPRMENE